MARYFGGLDVQPVSSNPIRITSESLHDEGLRRQGTDDRHVLLPLPEIRRDQGNTSCCVSMAIVACMEILMLRDGRYVELSPLYNYQWIGSSDGSLLQLMDGIKAVCKHGVAPNDKYPTPRRMTVLPVIESITQEICDAASKYTIPCRDSGNYGFEVTGADSLYHNDLGDSEDWKACLRLGLPIAIGLYTEEAYEELHHHPRYVYDLKPEDVTCESGHAVSVVGFDDNMQCFRILDSRGRRCDNGCWWLPYQALPNGVVNDAVVIYSIQYG